MLSRAEARCREVPSKGEVKALRKQRRRQQKERKHAAHNIYGESQERIEEVFQGKLESARVQMRFRQAAFLSLIILWAVLAWFTFGYGLMIWQLLPAGEEANFAKDWATGVAFDNLAQGKDILKETLEVVVVVIVLDRLHMLPRWMWFEQWLDHLSIQATLVQGRASMSLTGRLRMFLKFHKRID